MTSTQGTNGLLGQISQLWSMLDELSENDPAGYRKLLETQMKESADLRSPPELYCSIRAETLVSCKKIKIPLSIFLMQDLSMAE